MQKEKTIEVKNLKASFGNFQVLKDITFDVLKEEITVILGPSGCGKSTVLKHILGLYPVKEGEIILMGKNIAELTEKQQNAMYRQMGVFYQNGALLNSMTVGENVSLPLVQHSDLSDELIRELVNMKLSLVNLSDAYDKFPSELSGGMLKRAALARSIALDPPVLFFDEPGAGLDPISLESLDKLILNLKNKLGMTVVMVTHEVSSILRIADRIVYLDQGKVAFEGTLKKALETDTESVQQFFSILKEASKNL